MNPVFTGVASLVWSTASAAARVSGLRRARLPCSRVISVGNLQAGGAGKTPLVAMIAREAQKRGLVACILSRGYLSDWEKRGGVIAPGDPAPRTHSCGDEAALLHELAPHAWIAVGADRACAFARASERVKALGPGPKSAIDVAILDDGFQHHRLMRAVDILAVTDARRTDTVFLDFDRALAHSDLIVFTKGRQLPPSIEREAARFGIPVLNARYELPRAPEGLAPLCLVTGLASGGGAEVQSVLEAAGYRLAIHLPYRDHARYDREGVSRILNEARKEGHLVAITGKDWVKWREFGVDAILPADFSEVSQKPVFPQSGQVLVLEPVVQLVSGSEAWEKVLWEKSSL